MKLRTEVSISPYPHKMSYKSSIWALGSCFSVNIGKKLALSLYDIDYDIYGTTYNAASIYRQLSMSLDNELTQSALLHDENNQLYYHWDFPHTFSRYDESIALKEINTALRRGRKRMKDVDWVIITLGTSIIYELKSNGNIVANCHKMPSQLFSKRMLSIKENVEYLEKIIELIKSNNASTEIILTVSPVRHSREGLVENNRSKARLIEASHVVAQDEYVHYFPAYEIMMDDLRDYRYYTADLIHPSELALDYIWERFKQTCLDANDYPIHKEVNKLRNALRHKPQDINHPNHKIFIINTQCRLEQLKKKYPTLRYDRLTQ